MVFWEHEEHEVAYSWLRAPDSQNMAPGSEMRSPRFSPAPVRHLPRPPWGVIMLSFETTRSLSVFAVR
eukprot:5687278-Pyramimonas_sp.AAC.1